MGVMTDHPRVAQLPTGPGAPGSPGAARSASARAGHDDAAGPGSGATHPARTPAGSAGTAGSAGAAGAAGAAHTAGTPGVVGTAGTARRTGGLLAGVDWTRPRPRHEVVLLTKPGCHLCDDAREVVQRVCAQTGSALREQDITGDEALTRDYAEFVPVVFVDGAAWGRWRIDAERLRSVLE